MSADEEWNDTKLYRDLREKWKHEDSAVNHRVAWLLSTESFFLAAYGIMVNFRSTEAAGSLDITPTSIPWLESQTWTRFFWNQLLTATRPLDWAALILPFIGIFIALAIRSGLVSAELARRELRRESKLLIEKGYPSVEPLADGKFKGIDTAIHMPWVFILPWSIVTFFELVRLCSEGRFVFLGVALVTVIWAVLWSLIYRTKLLPPLAPAPVTPKNEIETIEIPEQKQPPPSSEAA